MTTTRPNGQYSNIVALSEERFKYEIMGKEWRGRKGGFDLQKAFKSVWKKLTGKQKKHWSNKFIYEWWRVGDDINKVNAPTERTNSGAFMIWWCEHITREGDKWVFSGKYSLEKDFMDCYEAIRVMEEEWDRMTPAEKFFYKNYGISEKDYNTPVNCCNGELCLSRCVKDIMYDTLGKKKMMDYWMTMMGTHYVYSKIYNGIQEGEVYGDDGTHLSICNNIKEFFDILGDPNKLSDTMKSFLVGICWKEGKTWGQAIKMWDIACNVVLGLEKNREEHPIASLVKGVNKMFEIFEMEEGNYYPVPADRLGTPSKKIECERE